MEASLETTGESESTKNPHPTRLLGADNLRIEFGSPRQQARKKKLITVGIHGNEISGVNAVQELFNEGYFPPLETCSDSPPNSHPISCPNSPLPSYSESSLPLFPVPSDVNITVILGNPKAYEEGKRFIDLNLNRLFTDHFMEKDSSDIFYQQNYEMSRLRDIAKEIEECDEYLDIHSTSAPTPPFAIPADNKNSRHFAAKYLPVDFVIEELATVLKGTTVGWAGKFNKTGVCVECGSHKERKSVEGAKLAIKQFISGIAYVPAKKILSCREYQTLHKGFKYHGTPPSAFEEVEYGHIIADDDLGQISCPYPDGAFIIMPTANPILGEEAWFWGHCKKTQESFDLPVPGIS